MYSATANICGASDFCNVWFLELLQDFVAAFFLLIQSIMTRFMWHNWAENGRFFIFFLPLASSKKGSTLVVPNKSCMNMSASHADNKSCWLRSVSESELRDLETQEEKHCHWSWWLSCFWLINDYFHLLMFCLLSSLLLLTIKFGYCWQTQVFPLVSQNILKQKKRGCKKKRKLFR